MFHNSKSNRGKAQAQTIVLPKLLDQEGVGATDQIFIKAIHIRKKPILYDIALWQLLDERGKMNRIKSLIKI